MSTNRLPRKLRHRPSDELVDIRERGLPWLLAVFILLFFLLTILLIFFIFTTREVYLSQRNLVGIIVKSNNKIEISEENDNLKDIHVDIVPILNRKTGNKDQQNLNLNEDELEKEKEKFKIDYQKISSTPSTYFYLTTTQNVFISTVTSFEAFTTTSSMTSTTTTTTASPTTSTALSTPSPTTLPASTTASPTTFPALLTASPTMFPTSSTASSTTFPASLTASPPTFPASSTASPPTFPVSSTASPPPFPALSTASPATFPVSVTAFPTTLQASSTASSSSTTTTTESPKVTERKLANSKTLNFDSEENVDIIENDSKLKKKEKIRIKWNRQIKSKKKEFNKFAITTHHDECSKIGRKIFDSGGNSIDATIASEFCISFVHPHSTGPGFGSIFLVYSSKRNGSFIIDGREKAPKNANQNTFVINPTIAHIGYSSMGIPGWISSLWTAFKQFGSGKILWKDLINPTIQLAQNGIFIDKILKTAFDSRKNHILHEKSFNSIFNKTTRENMKFENPEYLSFLKIISNSSHAEHDFYTGSIANNITNEMKNRGGLISRYDLENYSSIVTRSELLPIFDHFLAGPHLPYSFPILSNLFKKIEEKNFTNPEESIEYFTEFVKLLQKANQMKMFIGDDLFEPEVKVRIDNWQVPNEFKNEEPIDQTNNQKKNIQSFSRIIAFDNDGTIVNYMSTNTVPFGSVRRSQKYGFIWNNAISSFDVFCRFNINCVRGGSRPSVTKLLPSILLDSNKNPLLVISPTNAPLETTVALVLQSTIMNLTINESIDSPRIYSNSLDKVLVEAGIPEELYRHLWETFRAQYSHPINPVTLFYKTNNSFQIFCDYRFSFNTCFSHGV